MYCGDETGSFIGDIGSHTCRFGYGGEDNPKTVVPSYVMNKKYIPTSSLSSRFIMQQQQLQSQTKQENNNDQQFTSILRMSHCWNNNNNNSINSNNDDTTMKDNNNNNNNKQYNTLQPLVDPDDFLHQGDSVEHWDALEVVWHNSMETLRAKDTLKHTKGGTPYYNRNYNNNTTSSSSSPSAAAAAATATTAGSPSSTTVTSNTNNGSAAAAADGKCVHPLLAVTPGMTHYPGCGLQYSAARKRQQYIQYTELLMESMEASALFLAPTPMLSAFSLGRQTALIIDIGAGGTRVTPIVDGLVLEHSQRRNGRGGDWLGHITWKAILEQQKLQENHSYNIIPRYQLRHNNKQQQQQQQQQSSSSSLSSSSSSFQLVSNSSRLYHQWAIQELMYELRTAPHVELSSYLDDHSTPFLIPATVATTASTTMSDGETVIPPSQESGKPSSESITGGTIPTTPSSSSSIKKSETTTPSSSSQQQQQQRAPPSPTNSDSSTSSSSSSSSSSPSSYELPDGTIIDLTTTLGQDFCRIPELLFTDELPFLSSSNFSSNASKSSSLSSLHTISSNTIPIHKLVHQSLLSVGDVDIRKELASCMCLTGGCSVINNIETRLSSEISNLIPKSVCTKPKLIASRNNVERSYAPWIGASILTSLGSFQQLWLSRTEYEEYGGTLAIQRFP